MSARLYGFAAATILACALRAGGPPPPGDSDTHALLSKLVNKPYLKLMDLSETEVSQAAIDEFRKELEGERKGDLARVQGELEVLKGKEAGARKQLENLNRQASEDTTEMRSERKKLHAQILAFEEAVNRKQAERDIGVNAEFENKLAKLSLIQNWAGRRKDIGQSIALGLGRYRRHGDVDDIGVRKITDGQAKDIAIGMEGTQEMKTRGYLLSEMSDARLHEYVQKIADRIAANSDLRIPLRVTLLSGDEINAFGLPGGFLFVDAGLIGMAGDESQLAGVLAHEIAHIAARHGNKLTKGISVRNVFTEGAQMAANAFTAGAAGTATQYALEYGIFGLGLALNTKLLGVSPECEAEANQLGIQYLWRTGYDPRGFLAFIDKIADEAGFVRGASFFRTHPLYPAAMMASFCELEHLPRHGNRRKDTPEFAAAKKRLATLAGRGGGGNSEPVSAGDGELRSTAVLH